MPNYVFKEKERKNTLYAGEANASNLDKEYYCQTPNCEAKLTLRSLNGKRNPYFAALKSKPHSDFCIIERFENGGALDYDTSLFSIESLYGLITSTQESTSININPTGNLRGESENKQINTLSKLYYFCISHDINYDLKQGVKVKDIIADSRNNFFFTKNIRGIRMVECKFHRYIDKDQIIEFNYPINPNCPNKHKLITNFQDNSIYEKIKKKIFDDKKEYSSVYIIILGDWNDNKCEIKHWKQIIVV